MLNNKTFLITGISDKNSLAMFVAKEIINNGGNVVCTGLGLTKFHVNLSERAEAFLSLTYNDFKEAVKQELGDVETIALDITIEENIDELASYLKEKNINNIKIRKPGSNVNSEKLEN